MSQAHPEKRASMQVEHVDDLNVNVVKQVHIDGTVDLVDTRAIGGDVENMPRAYFYSVSFLGTLLVC